MSTGTLDRIREILPSYDELPDLLDAPTVYRLSGLRPQTLAADRCGARRLGLGFVRCGRLIRYPKTEVAKWLLRNAVGCATEAAR